ncbi:stabilizer of axonemal microtubules 2-like [Hippopotamus amphibius kiboko]|uniref:stabilizer of axonemal microtubules 2-like n=1 Tax=Hippopotamus amphibius kiboko TaxID=575201 RepID=UPI00259744FC|nr:stabilizer of axonemal microtubules 2-like [Hippopotamus amphibius kiboko]XP_057575948.1 stabilizer of axonemal microtubules 2-like [Hippopotamus amphibius kiboko]
MRTWCLCQICTCGRHHCPHGTTKIYENFDVSCPTTEYLEKYPMYGSVLPPQSLKRKEEFRAYRGKMEGITTFKSDYRPYEIVKQPHRAPEEYKPKQGEIDLGTTYKRDFNSYEVQPVAIVRPLERQQVKKGTLDTVPTYKDDYRAWDIQKSELYKPKETYCPPTVKFGNSTTFQDAYVPQEIKPRQSFKPSPVVKRSTAPFIGDTSHCLDYVPHQLEFKFARPKEVYKPADQPFEDLTTHRYDFQGLVGETAKICRPAYTRVAQHGQFEGSTEFRDSFQPWEIPPPEVKKVQEYIPPTGTMQLNSTSHLDYIPYQAKHVLPIRPVSHRRNHSFPFQGKSTMKEDFPAWESGRQGLIKKEQLIPNPSGKFDGLSTFRSHYVPHELIPTESCKPVNVPFKSSIPFDDVTMYSLEYAPKKQEICPASYPSPPGYIFENTNSRGHKFFLKITPTGTAF